MKRAIEILASLKPHARSFLLTRASPSRLYHFQACPYPHFSPLLFSSSLNSKQQRLHFSSNLSPILDLVVNNNEWSKDFETELSNKFNSTPLTHETVVYVLKNLEKTPQKAFHFFNWVTNNHGFNPNSLVYNQMLLILCNKETVHEFWGLETKMYKEGCDIDENNYAPITGRFKAAKMMDAYTAWSQCIKNMNEEKSKDVIVIGVVDALLGSDSDAGAREKLEKFKDDLSENKMLRIFRALDGYPLKGLFFFVWLKEHAGYTHSAVTYNAILRILKQKESITKFWSMINEMRNAGYDLDIDTYRKISRHFTKHMMVDDLVKLYELVMDGLYQPRTDECDFILKDIAVTETPDANLVSRVVKKHEAAGNSLSKFAYDGIYRCWANSGKFDEAEKILDTMRNAGYEPDEVTYGHVLFALGKAGRLEDVIRTLNEMEARGCNPDWKTYTYLIKGQCKRGAIDHALTCYTMISEKNLEVDADILGHLVKGLCSSGMVAKAYTMVTELVEKANFKPLHSTCNTLIENLLKEGELHKGLDLLPLMKKHAYPLPRGLLCDHVTKFGTMDDAAKLLAAFQLGARPTVVHYLHLFESFFKGGRQSEALDLLEKCPVHIRTNTHILNLFDSPKLESATP
ncbi:hypothetical protein ACHQM5_011018 [Ranunculus cassubicifolius]